MRAIMLAAGFVGRRLAYGLEWWSAVVAYPFNSGGRPLHSWPVFMLFPFEFGVLAAALAGLVAFFWCTGLPRLPRSALRMPVAWRATRTASCSPSRRRTTAARGPRCRRFSTNGAVAVSEVEA